MRRLHFRKIKQAGGVDCSTGHQQFLKGYAMKAETGHLKNGKLNLPPRAKEKLKQVARKREGERRAIDFVEPVLDWKTRSEK